LVHERRGLDAISSADPLLDVLSLSMTRLSLKRSIYHNKIIWHDRLIYVIPDLIISKHIFNALNVQPCLYCDETDKENGKFFQELEQNKIKLSIQLLFSVCDASKFIKRIIIRDMFYLKDYGNENNHVSEWVPYLVEKFPNIIELVYIPSHDWGYGEKGMVMNFKGRQWSNLTQISIDAFHNACIHNSPKELLNTYQQNIKWLRSYVRDEYGNADVIRDKAFHIQSEVMELRCLFIKTISSIDDSLNLEKDTAAKIKKKIKALDLEIWDVAGDLHLLSTFDHLVHLNLNLEREHTFGDCIILPHLRTMCLMKGSILFDGMKASKLFKLDFTLGKTRVNSSKQGPFDNLQILHVNNDNFDVNFWVGSHSGLRQFFLSSYDDFLYGLIGSQTISIEGHPSLEIIQIGDGNNVNISNCPRVSSISIEGAKDYVTVDHTGCLNALHILTTNSSAIYCGKLRIIVEECKELVIPSLSKLEDLQLTALKINKLYIGLDVTNSISPIEETLLKILSPISVHDFTLRLRSASIPSNLPSLDVLKSHVNSFHIECFSLNELDPSQTGTLVEVDCQYMPPNYSPLVKELGQYVYFQNNFIRSIHSHSLYSINSMQQMTWSFQCKYLQSLTISRQRNLLRIDWRSLSYNCCDLKRLALHGVDCDIIGLTFTNLSTIFLDNCPSVGIDVFDLPSLTQFHAQKCSLLSFVSGTKTNCHKSLQKIYITDINQLRLCVEMQAPSLKECVIKKIGHLLEEGKYSISPRPAELFFDFLDLDRCITLGSSWVSNKVTETLNAIFQTR